MCNRSISKCCHSVPKTSINHLVAMSSCVKRCYELLQLHVGACICVCVVSCACLSLRAYVCVYVFVCLYVGVRVFLVGLSLTNTTKWISSDWLHLRAYSSLFSYNQATIEARNHRRPLRRRSIEHKLINSPIAIKGGRAKAAKLRDEIGEAHMHSKDDDDD